MRALLRLSLLALGLSGGSAFAQNNEVAPLRGAFETGTLTTKWIAGSENCLRNTDPAIQVHEYNDNLVILRQNKCVNYEAPFMYLIFGAEKAILIDTGATRSASSFPLQKTVEGLLVAHYGADARSDIELVVAHSHAHGDHVAGDAQFQGKANTTVVGTSVSAVKKFFGITQWPTEAVSFDLGGRVLDIMPLPGHEASHIAVYDEQTGLLLTGDTLYPGRLYIDNWAQYRTSVGRLVSYMGNKRVSHVLGAHIELSTTPGVDYPIGSSYHPNEHDLPLTFETLKLLNKRLLAIGSTAKYDVQADFIIYP
ncbi:MAG: MBL fold metallo-hydrolase [Bdellovibrionota bacterium]